MVQTRRTVPSEGPQNTVNINQIILEHLEQQQKMIEEIRAAQARSDQERYAAIVAAVAEAVGNLR